MGDLPQQFTPSFSTPSMLIFGSDVTSYAMSLEKRLAFVRGCYS